MGSDALQVTVENVAPAIDAGPDQAVNPGAEVNFGGDFSDPGVLNTHTIEWDFGDGAAASGTLTATATHIYTTTGAYTTTLTVTDDDGGVGSDTVAVTVGPQTIPFETFEVHRATIHWRGQADDWASFTLHGRRNFRMATLEIISAVTSN